MNQCTRCRDFGFWKCRREIGLKLSTLSKKLRSTWLNWLLKPKFRFRVHDPSLTTTFPIITKEVLIKKFIMSHKPSPLLRPV